MAPEVFTGSPYGPAVDVFGFGILLYELFSRQSVMYAALTDGSIAFDVGLEAYARRVAIGQRPRIPQFFSPALVALVELCWAHDASRRPRMGEVLDLLMKLQGSDELEASHITSISCVGVCKVM